MSGEVIPTPEPKLDSPRTISSVSLEAVELGQKNVNITNLWGFLAVLAPLLVGAALKFAPDSQKDDMHQRVQDQGKQISELRQADTEAHREMRQDIRDLYQTIMMGRPSERLERPVDAGKP